MKTLFKLSAAPLLVAMTLGLGTLGLGTTALLVPGEAHAAMQGLDGATRAKIMRMKAQYGRGGKHKKDAKSAAGDSEQQCGSLGIGNTHTGGRRSRIGKVDTTVIVIGDVVNAANCR